MEGQRRCEGIRVELIVGGEALGFVKDEHHITSQHVTGTWPPQPKLAILLCPLDCVCGVGVWVCVFCVCVVCVVCFGLWSASFACWVLWSVSSVWVSVVCGLVSRRHQSRRPSSRLSSCRCCVVSLCSVRHCAFLVHTPAYGDCVSCVCCLCVGVGSFTTP